MISNDRQIHVIRVRRLQRLLEMAKKQEEKTEKDSFDYGSSPHFENLFQSLSLHQLLIEFCFLSASKQRLYLCVAIIHHYCCKHIPEILR